jgi:hypothetical protein
VVLGELDRLLWLKEQEMTPMQVSDESDELGYHKAFSGCSTDTEVTQSPRPT